MGSDTQLPAPPSARKLARVRLFAPDTTDDADLMVAGGVYALLAETPPARFPLIASCLRGGLGQGVQGSLIVASQPAAFLERLEACGYPDTRTDIETGRLRVFQMQDDFNKKMFRFGADSLVRELKFFQIPDESLLIFDQADDLLSLHDTQLAMEQVQAISAWAQTQQVTVLLSFNRAAGSQVALTTINSLMDQLQGIARLGVHRDSLTLSYEYWQTPYGAVAAHTLSLDTQDNGSYRVKAPAAPAVEDAGAGTTTTGTDDSDDPLVHCFTLDGDLMALQDVMAGKWQLCRNVVGVIQAAFGLRSPLVLLTYRRDTDLRQLAEGAHALRLALPRRTRIVVVEQQASLRYSNEVLLLRLGTNMVVHRDVPGSRLPLMLESLKGQSYTKDLDINFEAALASVVHPPLKGYVPATVFVRECLAMLQRSALLGIPNTLVVGRPAEGRTPVEVVQAVSVSRQGDMVSVDERYCYFFFSSCPRASQKVAMDSTFKASPALFFDEWEVLSDTEAIRSRAQALLAVADSLPVIEIPSTAPTTITIDATPEPPAPEPATATPPSAAELDKAPLPAPPAMVETPLPPTAAAQATPRSVETAQSEPEPTAQPTLPEPTVGVPAWASRLEIPPPPVPHPEPEHLPEPVLAAAELSENAELAATIAPTQIEPLESVSPLGTPRYQPRPHLPPAPTPAVRNPPTTPRSPRLRGRWFQP